MAISFLVALRVTELASAPLRRTAEAANLLTDAGARLAVQARAANAALISIAAAADTLGVVFATQGAAVEHAVARLSTATETTTTTMKTALDNAEKAAREFSTSYSASVEEIIKAQFRLATAGVPVVDQIEAVQGAYKLAKATNGEFLQSAELLGSFLNTFGKNVELNYLGPAEKVEKITDVMAAAVQRFQLDLNNLNDSLKFLVGPASTLGLSVSEVTAFAGALNTAGFRGTLAGTAISNAFNKIDNAVEKLDLDTASFTDASGNLKDFASFLDEIERATSNLTSIEKQSKFIEVFDIRAGRAIGTLIKMKEQVREFSAELDVSNGITQKLANTMEQTTTAKFKQFLNGLQNIASTLGGELNESIKPILDSLKELTIVVGEFASANKGVIAPIIGIGAAFLTTSAVILAFTLIVGRAAAALRILGASGAVAGLVVQSLLAVAALGKFAIAIGAVIIASSLLITGVKTLVSAFTGTGTVLERVGRFFLGLVESISAITFAVLGLRFVFVTLAPIIVASIAALIRWTAAAALATNATWLTTFAIRAMGVALIAIEAIPLVALLTAIAAAMYFAYKAGQALAGALDDIDDSGRSLLKFEQVEKQLGNIGTKTAKVAQELNSLAKISAKDIRIQIKGDEQFGNGQLALTRAASKAFKDSPGKTAKEAIDEAFKAAGGITGALLQVAKATKEGTLFNTEYAKSFLEIRNASDASFRSLSDIEKMAALVQSMVDGVTLAFEAIGDGSTQSTEALRNLTDAFSVLNEVDIRLIPTDRLEANLKKAFEALEAQGTLGAFSRAGSEAVQELGKQFQELQKKGESFTALSPDFQKLIIGAESAIGKVDQALEKTAIPAAKLQERLRAIQTPVNQIKTAMGSVANLFKNAESGGNSFTEAVEKSKEKILESEEALKGFKKVTEDLAKFRQFAVDSKLTGTEAFKDLEKLIADLLEIEVDARVRLDTGKMTVEANKFAAILGTSANPIIEATRKKLGDAFQSVVGDVLTGKVAQGNAFTSLADAFKTQFIDKIKVDIAKSIGVKFTDEFTAAVKAADDIIAQAQLGGTLFADFDSGKLGAQINEAVKAVTPQLQKLGIGDIFKLSDDGKLAKTFDDIFTDAAVKIVTTTNASVAALTQLQNILNEGPAKGQQELIDQASRLQRLLTEAAASGATDAVRSIEEALKAVLSQIRGAKASGPMEQIASISQQIQGTLSTVIATSAGQLTTASQQVENTIKNVTTGFAGQVAGASEQLTTATQQAEASITNVIDRTSGQLTGASQQAQTTINNVISSFTSQLTAATAQLTSASQQVELTITNIITRLTTAINSIPNAATEFINIIEKGFKRIGEIVLPKIDTATTRQASDIKVEIENGARTINVNITGNGSGDGGELTESEVKQIIEDTKRDMKAEFDETIRRLEDRLRGR